MACSFFDFLMGCDNSNLYQRTLWICTRCVYRVSFVGSIVGWKSPNAGQNVYITCEMWTWHDIAASTLDRAPFIEDMIIL